MTEYTVSWMAWSDVEAESEEEAIEKAKKSLPHSRHDFTVDEEADNQ